MYNVSAYGKMIADGPRIRAYTDVLRRAIKPGSVVVDLGSGPGYFAIVACELGARRVFAIEPDNIIQVGRDAAHDRGVADRIEFIQDLSTKVTLPEQADVIVSDLRGILPWFQQHIPSIIDARSRFLAPGGVLIPSVDRVWAAVVELPARYEEVVRPWEQSGLKSGRRLAVNSTSKVRAQPGDLLGQPVCWHELDYGHVEEVNFSNNFSLTATRAGTAHGLALWFDTELFEGTGFSNAPGETELIYGNAFFPFEQAVEIVSDDRFEIRLEARLIGEDYAWRWDTTVTSGGHAKCSFKQSTLFGVPLSVSQLHQQATEKFSE
ncbi:MAG TPA: 50S ribosomal protein L11 methyltransferase [Pyrinomonadaceae bacterium]|nr:50S ribosomal protein L11 methyltransferase [Pyrinomonadaceae bacterium]